AMPNIKLESLEASISDQLAAQGFTGTRMIELPVTPTIRLDSLEDEAEQMSHIGEAMGRGIEDTLADAFMGVETSFGDMLKRMAAQAAASHLLGLLGGIGGGGAGTVGGFFQKLGFGGGR